MKWMGQWGMETTARKTLMELGDRSQENVCGAARTRRTKSMEQGEGGESSQDQPGGIGSEEYRQMSRCVPNRCHINHSYHSLMLSVLDP